VGELGRVREGGDKTLLVPGAPPNFALVGWERYSCTSSTPERPYGADCLTHSPKTRLCRTPGVMRLLIYFELAFLACYFVTILLVTRPTECFRFNLSIMNPTYLNLRRR
jgi:hypothetical protein